MDKSDDRLGAISSTDGHRLERHRSGYAIELPFDQQHGGREAAHGENQDGVGGSTESGAAGLDGKLVSNESFRDGQRWIGGMGMCTDGGALMLAV